MLNADFKYLTLMTSLPALPNLFAARELPISKLRLNARLGMLDEEDALLMRRIESVMSWDLADPGISDHSLVEDVGTLMNDLEHPSLRRVITAHFELLSILAAMRRRRRGEPAPAVATPWGYGTVIDVIRLNWSRPHFALRRRCPWIAELRELHDAGATLDLEKAIARLHWQSLVDTARDHEFDFAAVVLYVLRHRLISQWLEHSADGARLKFDALVAAGLGQHAALLEEGT
ncbi:MAG: DUF2764 family protein [Gammaproteobacteria bacterium]|nr:DUF2764 family protein [Gammaproteobacteria bacterium]